MKNKIKSLRPEIIQQLLFTKSLLSQTQFLPEVNPISFSIAKRILIAHDAAEMGIAAIADQIGALPSKDPRYLMDYFDPIKRKKHSTRDVEGKEYFRQLNTVRRDLKHVMILPDPNQWMRVGDKVYDYLSMWCQKYLEISLNDLDNSILLNNPNVKAFYDNAKRELSSKNYRQVLELLARAIYLLFEENNALRSLPVGVARAEDAIKLAAFGVHANDYLVLQEFLPQVSKSGEDISIHWKQERFGHPGNWRVDSATFCMSAFLDLSLKIQNTDWIPGPIDFLSVYDHRIEATKDNVEIVSEIWESGPFATVSPAKKVTKVLRKGESIRGIVSRESKPSLGLLGSTWLGQNKDKEPERISIISQELPEYAVGHVLLGDVRISCIPKENDLVKEYLPNLPTMDMQLD